MGRIPSRKAAISLAVISCVCGGVGVPGNFEAEEDSVGFGTCARIPTAGDPMINTQTMREKSFREIDPIRNPLLLPPHPHGELRTRAATSVTVAQTLLLCSGDSYLDTRSSG